MIVRLSRVNIASCLCCAAALAVSIQAGMAGCLRTKKLEMVLLTQHSLSAFQLVDRPREEGKQDYSVRMSFVVYVRLFIQVLSSMHEFEKFLIPPTSSRPPRRDIS